MRSTERVRVQVTALAALADIQQFAALPNWLAQVSQSAIVAHLLRQSIPEFASGAATVHVGKIGGLRLNTATHTWTGAYTLTMTRSATQQREVLSLQGTLFPPGQPAPTRASTDTPFGAAGWRCSLTELRLELAVPPPEPDLPILPQLTDPDAARALLEPAMRQGQPAYRDLRIQTCAPEVLRYHPGLRATVRYRLTYPAALAAAHDWPALVVAKTYQGDKGRHADAGMRALWQTPLASGAEVTIAEPIAYLPQLKLLIQGPVSEEQTLKTLIESAVRDPTPSVLAALDAALHTTAAGLAALHRTPTPTGATYGWADELAEVRGFADNLASAVPELAGAAASLLAVLDVHAAATPPDANVFAHGTFRPNQVLLYQGRVGLIDFDSWCRAEPALDLALFCTSIKDLGLSVVSKAAQHQLGSSEGAMACRDHLARLEAICDTFVEYYAALLPISRQRIALWEALDTFTLVLRSWDRVKPMRLANTLLLLDRQMRRHFA